MGEQYKDTRGISKKGGSQTIFVDLKFNSALLYNKDHNFWKSVLTWKIPQNWVNLALCDPILCSSIFIILSYLLIIYLSQGKIQNWKHKVNKNSIII